MLTYAELTQAKVGAHFIPGKGTEFRLWAPGAGEALLHLGREAGEKTIPLSAEPRGYFAARVAEAVPGGRYRFQLDGGAPFADPASRFQPEGVFGASEIVAREFPWTDGAWTGLEARELVAYELHVGAFAGSFDGLLPRLPGLRELGINLLELMPVAQFPGSRNWGYDGVFPFAVQCTYGGPLRLKRLLDAAHSQGIGVALDVVYNHFGPEGGPFAQLGGYFHGRYHTPWGGAMNFDGPGSDEVKRFFCQNLTQWFEEFHFDALRLDALHAIFDQSAHPFLEQLGELKQELEARLGRHLLLIAESDLNDPRLLRERRLGGYELDCQWNDDFHHALHALLTGERNGYYADFGALEQLGEAYERGTVYRDRYSNFRRRSHGRSFDGIARNRLVAYSQNHDQVGNRRLGDRLIAVAGLRAQRLASACVFLSPFLPMLFMGEELGAEQPFLYFVDHASEELRALVARGRREEFRGFAWGEEAPDPGAAATFHASELHYESLLRDSWRREQLAYYRQLIRLSRWIRAEGAFEPPWLQVSVFPGQKALQLAGNKPGLRLLALFSFGPRDEELALPPGAGWNVLFGHEWVSFRERGAQPSVLVRPLSAALLREVPA